ncbi:LamG domain-containing protein [Akkermansiaceae bacterium]|nr:LamG domain-containing protein [Akkermansiaceae bacterium]
MTQTDNQSNVQRFHAFLGKTALTALISGTLSLSSQAEDGQDAVLLDDPDIYWTMGKLTSGMDKVFAVLGSDKNGLPLHAELRSNTAVLPMVVDGIVPNSDDGAIMFDAAESQALFVPNSPALNDVPGNPGTANRTYELWFQPRNLPVTGRENRQIIFEEGGSTRGISIYLDGTQAADPTEAELYIMTTNLAETPWGGEAGPGPTDPDFAINTTVSAGEIYHLVFVIDKPDNIQESLNGDLVAYLNGEEIGRVEDKVGLWYNHTDAIGIGRRYAESVFHDSLVTGADPAFFYDGVIDEFAIYDGTSLTADQARLHYLVGIESEMVPIKSFTSNEVRVASGDPVILSWEVNDFDALVIDNGVGDVAGMTVDGAGSTTVSPTGSTTYILNGTSDSLDQRESVRVHVGPPVINSFATTGAETILSGGSVTFVWEVSGEASLSISPDVGDASDLDSAVVSPVVNTTYTLTAINEFGSVTEDVTVTVSNNLLPTLGWDAKDVVDLGVEWKPTINSTGNAGIVWTGSGTVETGSSNFGNITTWINSPNLALMSNPADSFQDGLGDPVTKADVSWEFIFRPGDFEGLHTLFNTGGNGAGTAFVLNGSVLDFRFQNANNDSQRVIASSDLAEIGAASDFFHVVGVGDVDSATSGTARFFVNGELKAEVTSTGAIEDWDGGDLAELGKGNNIPGGNPFNPESFNGDIAVFNYFQGILIAEEQAQALFLAQGASAGALEITEIEVMDLSVELSWNSSPDRNYAIDMATSLDGDWIELADSLEAGDGPESTYTANFSEGNPQPVKAFFRVREE